MACHKFMANKKDVLWVLSICLNLIHEFNHIMTKFVTFNKQITMAHHEPTLEMTPIQIEFAEYMHRGDDFFKIELLRQAKFWYSKALDLNIETDRVKNQLNEVEKLLVFERKTVGWIALVASILILASLVLFR